MDLGIHSQIHSIRKFEHRYPTEFDLATPHYSKYRHGYTFPVIHNCVYIYNALF